MENTINGEHIVQIRGVQAEGKMAAPEKRLNRFVHLVAMTERLGNALGAMAFTWATIVLLGGYPDNLDSTYFWLATAIVFLEAIRMFTNDNRLDYQLFFGTRGDFSLLGWNGLLIVMVYLSAVPVLLSKKLLPWRQVVLNMCMLAAIVMLVFIFSAKLTYQLMIIVYEVSALLFLSSGNFQIPAAVVRVVLALISLSDGVEGVEGEKGSKHNLEPSLNIFYGMVLGQGILYIVACLVEVFSFIPRRYLIRSGGFGGQMGVEYVNSYYAYAFEKCMGGAVLAPKKISLITFAMDSLNSDSSRKKLYGVQMLHKFLKKEQLRTKTIKKLTKDTNTVASLFDMLGWTSEGDEEIRLFAAKVTAELAGRLRVVQIPGATQLVASLLDTDHQQTTRDHFLFIDTQMGREDSPIQQVGMTEQDSLVLKYLKQMAIYCLIPVDEPSNMHQRNSHMLRWWKRITKRWSVPEEEPSTDQDFLPIQGLLIIERLANFDPGNCMEISRTTGLISKMIDFISYRNHMTSTNEAHQIMLPSLSLRVLRRLASTEGKLGVTLRQQILEHPFVLRNLEKILDDDSGSSHELKQLAAEILKNLAMDRNTSADIGHILVIISSLMRAFLSQDPSSSTNSNHLLWKNAGQALAMLAMESRDNCLVMLMEQGYVFIRQLTTMMQDDRFKCIAASLLWNMCEHAQSELSNSDLKELSYILREVLEGIMDAEGAELEVLIGLSSQICQVIPEDFAREVEHGQIKEKFIKRLVEVLNAHMKPSAHCPRIRRVIVQHAIYLMEFNSRYANDFHKCWMVEALSMVERTPSRAENYRLFSGDTGLMEHNTPLTALVARAKELMGREWVRGISSVT
uniref:BLE2 protein n=1 Tax=Oryza glaberrima TaxID=4538 RepID=I1QCR0_ORYGL